MGRNSELVWPSKAGAIAGWLREGIEQWREVQAQHDGRGSPNSLDFHDRLTLDPQVRSGEIGQTALLIAGGATEMLRGVASLYAGHLQFPITRFHLPVVRSLQEHAGRALWLVAPGMELGTETSGQLADDAKITKSTAAFHERVRRLRQIKEELLDDHLRAAGKYDDADEQRKWIEAGALSQKQRRQGRQRVGEEPMPTYTEFAELAERSTQQLHLRDPERTNAIYSRISATGHGTLLGMLADSDQHGALRPFISDDRDLEFVAARAGRWWITMIAVCSAYFAWEWEAAFANWDQLQRTLFDQPSN